MKRKIISHPDEWILTPYGDFVCIKDSEITEEENLKKIRNKLKRTGRFLEETPEQSSKKRYDKVWEEIDFDYKKLHG